MIAAIYTRKSTDQLVTDDQKSIARQVEHARAYAKRKGWTVADAHVYTDDGISGAEFAKRPGFIRLMNALKPRAPFQVLIMSEESRLGRESIETAYALKQLVQAGVRVWFYLEDRERTLDNPVEKLMMSVAVYADEQEREKTRQRTYDAMVRKAKAGHVTGGRVFGYDNLEIVGPDGRRSHVERRINADEAAIVRRIFEMRANGIGQARIARTLNAEGAIAPKPRKSGPQAWSPSTVREILFRELYRGRIVWNRKRKRNQWGQEKHSNKPQSEWMSIDAPTLRMLSDLEWHAAHRRMEQARGEYERTTGGRRCGRPHADSKYLLVGFARCGVCGGGLCVQSRSEGKRGRRRAFVYRCLANHQRGRVVCSHGQLWPMDGIDQAVLAAIAGDVLTPDVIEAVVEGAQDLFAASRQADAAADLRDELARVTAEQNRLADGIATSGGVPVLVQRLQATERRRLELVALLEDLPTPAAPPSWGEIERRVRQNLTDWRSTLLGRVDVARDAFRQLLSGPIRFTPFVEEGQRGLRFEGRIGLEAIVGGELRASMELTRGGTDDSCTAVFRGKFIAQQRAAA